VLAFGGMVASVYWLFNLVAEVCDLGSLRRRPQRGQLHHSMADTFDPYREALIVEVETSWPDEYDDWEPAERARVERLLHQAPDEASHLEYVRTHTGFCRRIVVTPEDLARVGA
jgi:hypothetical protein